MVQIQFLALHQPILLKPKQLTPTSIILVFPFLPFTFRLPFILPPFVFSIFQLLQLTFLLTTRHPIFVLHLKQPLHQQLFYVLA